MVLLGMGLACQDEYERVSVIWLVLAPCECYNGLELYSSRTRRSLVIQCSEPDQET